MGMEAQKKGVSQVDGVHIFFCVCVSRCIRVYVFSFPHSTDVYYIHLDSTIL